MTKVPRPYCREILDRIRRIENYTSAGRDAFLESELLQDGVIRSFEVIGEVVKQLAPARHERIRSCLEHFESCYVYPLADSIFGSWSSDISVTWEFRASVSIFQRHAPIQRRVAMQ